MGWYLLPWKNRTLDRNVTGAVYRDVLEQNMLPRARQLYNNNWTLADDNARPHRAALVVNFLEQQDVNRMDWAPYSPDMKPIEHAWDEIGRRLEDLTPQPQNLIQLGAAAT